MNNLYQQGVKMIKAYLYFQDDVLNIGSCKDDLSIKDYILGNNNQDDSLYIQLHQIPTIGECIYIASSPIELEIVDIYHCVNLPFDWNHNAPCNHVVKLLCKATKLSDWKRI